MLDAFNSILFMVGYWMLSYYRSNAVDAIENVLFGLVLSLKALRPTSFSNQ
jgi:hypothetical protein